MQPPESPDKKKSRSNASYLMEYISLAFQLVVTLGVAVFLGLKADEWIGSSFPLLAWIFPLLVIAAMLVRVIKDTSRKNGKK
jgi:uncharacterized membrane protein YkvI